MATAAEPKVETRKAPKTARRKRSALEVVRELLEELATHPDAQIISMRTRVPDGREMLPGRHPKDQEVAELRIVYARG